MKNHFMNTVSTLALSIVLLSASANAMFSTKTINQQEELNNPQDAERCPFQKELASLDAEEQKLRAECNQIRTPVYAELYKLDRDDKEAQEAARSLEEKLSAVLRPFEIRAETEEYRGPVHCMINEVRDALKSAQKGFTKLRAEYEARTEILRTQTNTSYIEEGIAFGLLAEQRKRIIDKMGEARRSQIAEHQKLVRKDAGTAQE